MDIKIEKGVPIPPVRAQYVRYPLLDMKKGDSFTIPAEWRTRVSVAATKLKRKHGLVFTVRRISETEARCWRIK